MHMNLAFLLSTLSNYLTTKPVMQLRLYMKPYMKILNMNFPEKTYTRRSKYHLYFDKRKTESPTQL